MYCLAPLSAIDLNQDNNNTLKELNDTSNDTKIDNVNETINDNVNETINEDNMNFEIEKVNETENNTGNETKLQYYIKPEIKAWIDDTVIGKEPILHAYIGHIPTPLNAFYNDYLYISCPQFSKEYAVWLYNPPEEDGGFDSVINEPNLEPGIYKVHLYYPGNAAGGIAPWSDDIKFQVSRNSEPNLRLNIGNISQGEKLKVKITADEELNGTIHLNLNERIHTFHVTNGVGETSISGLGPGTYKATATFNGNYLFQEGEAITKFKVMENDNPKALLSLHVDDIDLGEDAKLQIKSQDTFNETVKVKIKGVNETKEMTVKVTDGAGETTIPDLKVGNYAAIAIFDGNDKFKPSENATAFIVNRYNPHLKINVDILYDKNAVIKIKANETLNGDVKVNVKSDDNSDVSQELTVKIYDGTGQTVFRDLSKGNYTVSATFKGDDVYRQVTETTSFKVCGNGNPNLSVDADDIIYGENATIKIKANETFNGDVKVNIKNNDTSESQELTLKINDGTGQTSISDLNLGEYSVSATFKGDDEFKPDTNTTSFKVCGNGNPNLSVQVDDTIYGENTTIKIKANETFSGYVKVNLNSENDSKTVMVNVKEGVGDASVGNLITETYSVDAIFEGNNTFKPDHASTSFNVGLAEPNISMTTENIGTQSQLVKIRAKNSFNGDIKLKLKSEHDYQEVTIKVVDGVGETTLSHLVAFDTYNATAIFDGNKFFKPGSANASFKVKGRL